MSKRIGGFAAGDHRWKGWGTKPTKAAPVKVVQEASKEPPPMTKKQASFLRDLCRQKGVKFNPKWTRKQASKRITQLKRKR